MAFRMTVKLATVGLMAGLALFQPSVAFATGAIAVDDEAGQHPDDTGYGIATNKANRAAAEREAMRLCRSHAGNTSCRVAVWFESCGAYAGSYQHYGIGYGRSERVAEDMALNACNTRGCKIVISGCD